MGVHCSKAFASSSDSDLPYSPTTLSGAREELRDHFNHHNSEHNHGLSLEQMRQALEAYQIQITPNGLRELIRKHLRDEASEIIVDWPLYLYILSIKSPIVHTLDLTSDAFGIFDEDQDGRISSEEFRNVLRALGYGYRTSEHVKQLFSKVNATDDRIDQSQMTQAMRLDKSLWAPRVEVMSNSSSSELSGGTEYSFVQ